MLVLPMCMLMGSNISCTASCMYLMCTSHVYITGIVQEVVSSKDNTNDFLLCVFVKAMCACPT